MVGPAPDGRVLTVRVPCRTSTDRRVPPMMHTVAISQDWTVSMPHDLYSERVGVALGGHASCVGLVDSCIPALCAWVLLMLRQVRPGIAWTPASATWCLDAEAPCCYLRRFPSLLEAAQHARSLPHLGARHGADLDLLFTMAAASRHAYGRRMDFEDRSDATRLAVDRCAGGYRDVIYLWSAGLAPSGIVRVHEENGASGPLLVELYIDALTRPGDTMPDQPDDRGGHPDGS